MFKVSVPFWSIQLIRFTVIKIETKKFKTSHDSLDIFEPQPCASHNRVVLKWNLAGLANLPNLPEMPNIYIRTL